MVPWWRVRATLKARGAARRPISPINGARAAEAALPRARPTQTMVAQEIFCTVAAATVSRLGTSPEPAAMRRSTASIARPRRIESHAARRIVAPKLEPLAELAETAPATRPGLFTNRSSSSSTAPLLCQEELRCIREWHTYKVNPARFLVIRRPGIASGYNTTPRGPAVENTGASDPYVC